MQMAFFGNNRQVYEIIGVVGDTIYEIGQPVMATVYRPIFNGDPKIDSLATIVVRTAVDPLSI